MNLTNIVACVSIAYCIAYVSVSKELRVDISIFDEPVNCFVRFAD